MKRKFPIFNGNRAKKIMPIAQKKFLILCALAACVALLGPASASATPALGSAQSFAVLGASTVTNTNTPTQIFGNLGVSPGSSITNFPPGSVTGGSIHTTDSVAQQAQLDALNAYNTLAALAPTQNLSGQDLGSVGTLTPGVYRFNSTAGLTGALTLDFQNTPNANFVFQVGTALTTASASSVNVINGGSTDGVYWLMGVTGGSGTGSATLGTTTMFAGNILALDSITVTTGADILCGRAIALNAAVTLDDNLISNNNTAQDFGTGRADFGSYGFSGSPVPVPPIMLLLGSGLAGLVAFRKRFRKA